LSAGRQSGKKARVVDVHAHLVPLDPGGIATQNGVRVVDGPRLEIDGHVLSLDRLYAPERLVEWMDANSIDTALVSAPPPAYRQQLDAEQAGAWTAYLNDGLAAFAAGFPGRLQALAHLPLEHPAVAAREAAGRQGEAYAGFSLPAGGAATIRYADPTLRPVWAALQQHASFAFLHPGVCADGRLSAFYGHNLLGNPFETAVAVAELVFGGIVEDFPAIRFCLAHCGGVVPAVAGRWQQGFETGRPGIDTRRQPPRRLLKRFWVDCVAHDHDLVALAAQVFGADRIVLGSDWPYPMGLGQPREWLRTLPAGQQQNILSRNVAALLNGSDVART
jgi:aminocarboxymuconate-semialdehyde decarboxylase